MLTPLDHLLTAALAIAAPVRSISIYRKLMAAPEPALPGLRRAIYLGAILTQWGLLAALALHWSLQRRPWEALGFVPQWTPGLLGAGSAGLAMSLILLRQSRAALADPAAHEGLRRALAPLERLLPHDRGELRLFRGVALTAGVCEEALYRGFLIWYLGRLVGPWPAMIVAAIVFGLGHAYQGSKGVIKTGIAGLFLGAVYLVSGSLLAPMVFHALIDLHSGWVAHRVFGRPAAEAA
jgi:membrane protease YdiL (CAAX protease family)